MSFFVKGNRFWKKYLAKWRNNFHSEKENQRNNMRINGDQILTTKKFQNLHIGNTQDDHLRSILKIPKRPLSLCPLLLSFFFRSASLKAYFSSLFSNIKIERWLARCRYLGNVKYSTVCPFQNILFKQNFFQKLLIFSQRNWLNE